MTAVEAHSTYSTRLELKLLFVGRCGYDRGPLVRTALDDFDVGLLPERSRARGTPAFTDAVRAYFAAGSAV
jgi:hypothetical protein